MSRGAFFLALIFLVIGLSLVIAALRGRGSLMLQAIQDATQTKKQ